MWEVGLSHKTLGQSDFKSFRIFKIGSETKMLFAIKITLLLTKNYNIQFAFRSFQLAFFKTIFKFSIFVALLLVSTLNFFIHPRRRREERERGKRNVRVYKWCGNWCRISLHFGIQHTPTPPPLHFLL